MINFFLNISTITNDMFPDILNKLGLYDSNDVKLFESKAIIRTISKDSFLLKPDEVCRSIYYNLNGAFYQYKRNDDLEENVIDLHIDNEWFLNYNSFISQKPSDSFIKAYVESEILVLNIESLHYLINESHTFLQLNRIFEPAISRVYFYDNRLTPTEKYLHVLEHKSGLLRKFPLKMIASYLKISPETLSRVRESISKMDKTIS